jgi:hypothetical protein
MAAASQSNHIVWALVLGLVTVTGVTACGGGGGSGAPAGGGGVSISYTGVTTAATITSSNAASISGAAVNGVTTSAESGGALIGVVSPGNAVGTTDTNSIVQTVKKLASQVVTPVAGNAAPLGLAAGSNVIPGSCGGNVVVTASPSATTVTGTLVYNNYCEAGTVFVSGTNNFTANVTVNGTGVTIDSIMITTAPGARLSVYVQRAGLVYWANNLDLTVNSQSSYDDVSVSATYYHPTYGYVTLTTPYLHIMAGDLYPSSGSLLLTDTANRRALISVIDDTTYRLQIDADADGVYETTTQGLWSSL